MKKIVLVVCALVVVAVVAVIAFGVIRKNQADAIVAVINDANLCLTQNRVTKSGQPLTIRPGSPLFNWRQFGNDIGHVAVLKCPEQFQVAWLNYVQAVQRDQTPFARLGVLGEYGVSAYRGNAAGVKDAMARLDRMNAPEAYRRVVMVALHYGVQISPR